jgi:glycerophosphoryl diester phosphodiesterase
MSFTERSEVHMSPALRELVSGPYPALLCHRGFGRGSVPENTAAAVRASVLSHADIVELDVVRSTDGEFFLFHDGQEARHFGDAAPAAGARLFTLSSEEIGRLRYGWHREHGSGVERLTDILEQFPDVHLQLDRSWRWWPELFPVLRASDRVDTLHLKAPVREEPLRALQEHGPDLPFMAIVTSLAELDRVRSSGINLVGYELLAPRADHELADVALIRGLKAEGRFVQLNALTLPEDQVLFAGYDDHVSITVDPDLGWGRLLEYEPSILQTDWPHLVWNYLRYGQGS